jgi:hypothetical protein
MNAEIEHASEYGKAEGEKVPGERRKIGPALKRAWEQRLSRSKPAPVEVLPKEKPQPPTPVPRPVTAFRNERHGWSDWMIGAPVVLAQALWTLRSYRNRIKT